LHNVHFSLPPNSIYPKPWAHKNWGWASLTIHHPDLGINGQFTNDGFLKQKEKKVPAKDTPVGPT